MSEKKPDNLRSIIFRIKENLKAVTKGAYNPFHNSKYADLNAHLDEIEPLLAKEGMFLTQPVVASQLGNVVVSKITHVESGESIESSMKLPDLQDMQKLGGCITYARRYTLNALLAMKNEDDDGNTAAGLSNKKGGGRKPAAPKKSSAPSDDTDF